MYKHILIATDGSELARKGVEHGLELAKVLNARVTVLTVTRPLQPAAVRAALAGGIEDPTGFYDQQIDEALEKQFSSVEQAATEHGVTVDLDHEIDEFPAEAIVRVARLKGCDLIIMSSHGRRGLQRVLLGSQTSEVLVNTPIPVLVIR